MFQWLASLRYGRGHVELVDDLNQLLEESWDDMLTAYRRGRHGRQESRYATPRPTSEFEQKVYIARHKKPPRASHPEDPLRDPYWARRESERKRELLELKLKDAEWILEYEKRLAELQKKTARQRSRAEQVGTNTDRLRKLEHHLAGLRQNLSLD